MWAIHRLLIVGSSSYSGWIEIGFTFLKAKAFSKTSSFSSFGVLKEFQKWYVENFVFRLWIWQKILLQIIRSEKTRKIESRRL